MQQALLIAVKIIIGIRNGATRSQYVPVIVNTLIVKEGHLHIFNGKVTYIPETSAAVDL
jgi:ABC-type uncharacterized transport system ATPase component